MVNNLESGPIVTGGQIRFGDGHSHSVAKSLTERASGSLYAWSQAALGMTGRETTPLTELLDLLEGQIIAREIQQAVQQHRPVTGRQDESVTIKPLRIDRVVPEPPCPQHIRHR